MTKLHLTILASILFATIAFIFYGGISVVLAKQVSIDVVKDTVKNIQAEVTLIPQGTDIDLRTPFSALDRAKVKQGINFSQKESEMLDKAFDKVKPSSISEGQAQISAFVKLFNEKKLSRQEQSYMAGFNGHKKTLSDVIIYLSRKKVLDTI